MKKHITLVVALLAAAQSWAGVSVWWDGTNGLYVAPGGSTNLLGDDLRNVYLYTSPAVGATITANGSNRALTGGPWEIGQITNSIAITLGGVTRTNWTSDVGPYSNLVASMNGTNLLWANSNMASHLIGPWYLNGTNLGALLAGGSNWNPVTVNGYDAIYPSAASGVWIGGTNAESGLSGQVFRVSARDGRSMIVATNTAAGANPRLHLGTGNISDPVVITADNLSSLSSLIAGTTVTAGTIMRGQSYVLYGSVYGTNATTPEYGVGAYDIGEKAYWVTVDPGAISFGRFNYDSPIADAGPDDVYYQLQNSYAFGAGAGNDMGSTNSLFIDVTADTDMIIGSNNAVWLQEGNLTLGRGQGTKTNVLRGNWTVTDRLSLSGNAIAWNDVVRDLIESPRKGVDDVVVNALTNCVDFLPTATTNLTDDHVFGVVQFPHTIDTNYPIYPHIHFLQTAADQQTNMYLSYQWIGIGQTNSGAWTQLAPASNELAYTAGILHQLASFPSIPGGPGISSMFIWKIHRQGSVGTGVMKLLDFDIHHAVDGFGSDAPSSKSY